MDSAARLLEQIAWDTNRRGSAFEALHRALAWISEHTRYHLGHACLIIGTEGDEVVPISLWHGAEGPRYARFRERSESMTFSAGIGLLGQVLEARVPVQIYDVLQDRSYVRRAEAEEAGLRGAFAVPVLAGEHALAALELYSSQPRLLEEDQVGLMAAAGVILGRSVERDRFALERAKRDAQLQQAEKIAQLGTWEWHVRTNEVSWSKQLYRIYGIEDEFEGTIDAHIRRIGAGDEGRVGAILDGVLDTQRPFEFEARIIMDDKPRYLLTRGEVVLDARGEPARVVGVCQDVTFLKDAKERETRLLVEQTARQYAEHKAGELERLTRELERSNRELNQFAYVASHDLKAPLRGIANLSEWLEEDLAGHLHGDSRKHLDLLRGRVRRMDGLIDGLLAYSRVGRAAGTPEELNVHLMLEEVIELLAPGNEVDLSVAPDMPVLVAERVPLQQVFHNLIGNALKHGRADQQRVEIRVHDEGDFYRFHVADNGPGIAPEYQDKIWQIFQTLQPRDKVEGTGIGLALVKKIVERYGGTVWVESAVNQGATFYFRWPKASKPDTPDEEEKGYSHDG